MAKYKNTQLLASFLFLLLTVLLCSCSDENLGSGIPDSGKQKSVTFSVRIPGSATPQTFALDDTDENEVKTIEVLLFDLEDKFAATPVYSNIITTAPGNSNIKSFTVKVPEGVYNMVILANALQSLATALKTVNLGDTKAVVLNKILLANAGKWNSIQGSENYIPIPMWGEINNITVSSTMPANNPITMLRMVARIDVSLNAVSQGKLKLKSVRLYNFNNQGSVAPADGNWSVGQQKVTAPSVPATAKKPTTPEDNPLVYNSTAITTPDIKSEGKIYTFEATKGTIAGLLTNTCLVVGGLYDTDVTETFYRVDFANTTGGITTYLNLLRNYQYKVLVSDVLGAGLPSPKEAFKSRPVNILATVLGWSDGRFTGFDINDQYLLGVSQGEFSFSKEARTADNTDNTLSVITDYSGGWKIDKIVDAAGVAATWLTCSLMSGNNPAGNDIKLLMGVNTTGALRTAYIHLSAERLTYIVKVDHDIFSKLAIDITDVTGSMPVNTLFFTTPKDVQPAQQQFKVSWAPSTEALTFSTSSFTNVFVFAAGAGLDQIPLSGTLLAGTSPKTYTIRPPAISTADLAVNPFYERTSTIQYTITDGHSMASKTINLRQVVPNLVTTAKAIYKLDGSTYSFNVRSNADWRIKSVTPTLTSGSGSLFDLQASDNLRVGTTGSYNTGVGTPISFRVANDASGLAGKVRVVFESTVLPKLFSDVIVDFDLKREYYPKSHTGWAGSNIYWDGTKLTFDDVNDQTHNNYQGVYFQWGSLWGISPMGDWSGKVILYSPQGTSGTANSYGYGTWGSWPRHSDANVTSSPPFGKTERDRAYLYEDTDGTKGIGDICKYLTDKGWAPGNSKWRLPTSNEFDLVITTSNYGTYTALQSNDMYGRYLITAGKMWENTALGVPSFPASGYRRYETGDLLEVGLWGVVWSSSARYGDSGLGFGYDYEFTESNIDIGRGKRAQGASVRCVQE